jgi:hypothetical protein
VTEADGIKRDEIIDCARHREGVRPGPIRIRGYYRALKRKETWAMQRKYTLDTLSNLSDHLIHLDETSRSGAV